MSKFRAEMMKICIFWGTHSLEFAQHGVHDRQHHRRRRRVRNPHGYKHRYEKKSQTEFSVAAAYALYKKKGQPHVQPRIFYNDRYDETTDEHHCRVVYITVARFSRAQYSHQRI